MQDEVEGAVEQPVVLRTSRLAIGRLAVMPTGVVMASEEAGVVLNREEE
jgi:hypothetical protein